MLERLLRPVLLKGEIKVDESYFHAWRVRGKHGRGVKDKVIVFGLLKDKERFVLKLSIITLQLF